MITSIRDFFRAIRKKFSRQAGKFWRFLKENVFPLAKAVIMQELKDFARGVIANLSMSTLTNEEKRNQAFDSIKQQAKLRGINIKDSLIYLLIEVAVTSLKNEAE